MKGEETGSGSVGGGPPASPWSPPHLGHENIHILCPAILFLSTCSQRGKGVTDPRISSQPASTISEN